MFTLIIILLIIVSFLLCIVVLVQNSKGGGLASGFASSNQIMGVRKTTDFLEKLTWGFAISMFVLAMIANFALPKNSKQTNSSIIEEQLQNTPAAPSGPAPVAQPPAQGGNAAPAGNQPASGTAPAQ